MVGDMHFTDSLERLERTYDDYRALAQDPTIDAVEVLTPHIPVDPSEVTEDPQQFHDEVGRHCRGHHEQSYRSLQLRGHPGPLGRLNVIVHA